MPKLSKTRWTKARKLQLVAALVMLGALIAWITISITTKNMAIATVFTLLPASTAFSLLMAWSSRLEMNERGNPATKTN